MKVSDRITWIIVGLVCGYFAVVAGDAVHQWVAADMSLPKPQGNVILAVSLSVLLFFGASFMLVSILGVAGEDVSDAVASAFILAILAFLFGEFAGPITAYGPYPWQWYSGLSILLVLGAVPMTFAIKDVVSDIIAARRHVKGAKSNVVPLKREDKDRA